MLSWNYLNYDKIKIVYSEKLFYNTSTIISNLRNYSTQSLDKNEPTWWCFATNVEWIKTILRWNRTRDIWLLTLIWKSILHLNKKSLQVNSKVNIVCKIRLFANLSKNNYELKVKKLFDHSKQRLSIVTSLTMYSATVHTNDNNMIYGRNYQYPNGQNLRNWIETALHTAGMSHHCKSRGSNSHRRVWESVRPYSCVRLRINQQWHHAKLQNHNTLQFLL